MADGYLNFDTKINEKGFNKGVDNLGKSIASLGKSIGSIGKSLTKGITIPALGAATAVAGITFSSGFKRMLAIDQAKVKLEALGNTTTQVANIMNDALSSVVGTSYNLDEAATTAASAVAAGIQPGKELSRYLSLVADAAAVAGSDMGSMGAIFNKVTSQGKANNEVLQQLAEQGIPIYQWLADEIGVTASAVFDMASSGEIDLATFENAVEKHIGGSAKILGSKTISGAFTNVTASIARIGQNLIGTADDAETVAGQLLNLINWVTEKLGKIEPIASDLGKTLGTTFGTAVRTVQELIDWLDGTTTGFENMNRHAATIATTISPIVEKFKALSAPQKIGLITQLVAAGPVLTAFGGAVQKVGTGISGFSKVTGGFEKAVGGVVSGIGKLPGTVKGIASSFSNAGSMFKTLGNALLIPFEGIGDKIGGVLGKVSYRVGYYGIGIKNQLSKLITPITGTIGKFIAPFKNIGSAVLQGLGKIGTQISGYGSVIGSAFKPILSKAATFAPAFLKCMNIAGGLGIVVAGLGLLQGAFGDQIGQILTMVQTKGPEVITNFCNGITAALPNLITQGAALLNNLLQAITANLPAIISGGISIVTTLISGIAQQLPTLIPTALMMIVTLVGSLLSNVGQIVDAGIDLLVGLAQGLVNALPQLINQAPTIIGRLATAIISNLPKILQAGIKIITILATGLVQAIPQLISKIPAIISQIKNAFTSVNWGSVGMNIIKGIASGLTNAAGAIVDAAKSAASKALDAAKNFLGIHSPSRVFRDQVGKMMALGMGIGFEKNIPIRSMSAGVQKAVSGLQKSVNIAMSGGVDTPSVGKFENMPGFNDKGSIDYDRLEKIQMRAAEKMAKRPIFLGTKRIDEPLPKGAVPAL